MNANRVVLLGAALMAVGGCGKPPEERAAPIAVTVSKGPDGNCAFTADGKQVTVGELRALIGARGERGVGVSVTDPNAGIACMVTVMDVLHRTGVSEPVKRASEIRALGGADAPAEK